MSVSVVTLGAGTWDLVDEIERQHGAVTVVRRCLDLSELLACAHSGMARVALLAEGAEELTASLLEQLALSSVHVMVLAGHDEARLSSLGVTVVPEGTAGRDVSALIESVASAPHPASSPRGHSHPETPAEGGSEHHERGSAEPTPRAMPHAEEPAEKSTASGRIIAVWGPMGAPGRTVTALNIAAELALAGTSVLVIDADTYAASVAASLGMLEEAAGLAQACRLADQGRLDSEGLRRCATPVTLAGATVHVLTGLTRHDRWPEVRAAALDTVLLHARKSYGAVVVDTSFGLESDEEITLDTVAPRRNAATLSACAMADTVLAIGSADALGIPRLVKSLPDLTEVAPTARVMVVINKLRKSAVGRSATDSVAEAWSRYSPGTDIAATLDWDPVACDEALLAGAVLCESAPKSPLRQQFTRLAEAALTGKFDSARTQAPVTTAPGTRLGQRMGAWLRR